MDKKSYFGKEAIISLPHQFQGEESTCSQNTSVSWGVAPPREGGYFQKWNQASASNAQPGVCWLCESRAVCRGDRPNVQLAAARTWATLPRLPPWGAAGNSRGRAGPGDSCIGSVVWDGCPTMHVWVASGSSRGPPLSSGVPLSRSTSALRKLWTGKLGSQGWEGLGRFSE